MAACRGGEVGGERDGEPRDTLALPSRPPTSTSCREARVARRVVEHGFRFTSLQVLRYITHFCCYRATTVLATATGPPGFQRAVASTHPSQLCSAGQSARPKVARPIAQPGTRQQSALRILSRAPPRRRPCRWQTAPRSPAQESRVQMPPRRKRQGQPSTRGEGPWRAWRPSRGA